MKNIVRYLPAMSLEEADSLFTSGSLQSARRRVVNGGRVFRVEISELAEEPTLYDLDARLRKLEELLAPAGGQTKT